MDKEDNLTSTKHPRARRRWLGWLGSFAFGVATSLAATVIFEAFKDTPIAAYIPGLNVSGQLVVEVRHPENGKPIECGELSRLQVVDKKTNRVQTFDMKTYALGILQPGEYRVDAFVNGMLAGSSEVRIDGRGESRARVDTLNQAQVRILVRHRNGRPAVGMRVQILAPGGAGAWRTALTNADGLAIGPDGPTFFLHPTTRDTEGYIVRVSRDAKTLLEQSPVKLKEGQAEQLELTID